MEGQRSCVSKIASIVIPISENTHAAVSDIETRRVFNDQTMRYVQNFFDSVKVLCGLVPVTPSVQELGPVTDKQLELLKKIDGSGSLQFYVWNKMFEAVPSENRYYLIRDIDNFVNFVWDHTIIYLNYQQHNVLKVEICDEIQTDVDFFTHVFLPLLANIQTHAFNSDNDIYKRSGKKPDFFKLAGISWMPDPESKKITITVLDKGFGMRPEIMANLFQKGVSSKTDASMEHGVGLWAVKQFVEEHGCEIICETELGKWTEFKVVIPYREKEELIYIV